MPNIKSSKKDVISSKIAYEKNKADKSELKTDLKKFDAALVSGDKAAADVAYKTAVKAVDQAVNKGLPSERGPTDQKEVQPWQNSLTPSRCLRAWGRCDRSSLPS